MLMNDTYLYNCIKFTYESLAESIWHPLECHGHITLRGVNSDSPGSQADSPEGVMVIPDRPEQESANLHMQMSISNLL